MRRIYVPAIFGGAHEHTIAESFLTRSGIAGLNFCGLSLAETAEAMKRCKFYFGNDTGTMHLAAVMGLRCVAIFSSQNAPDLWQPIGNGHIIVRKNISCEGCGLHVCKHNIPKCLANISVAEIIETFQPLVT